MSRPIAPLPARCAHSLPLSRLYQLWLHRGSCSCLTPLTAANTTSQAVKEGAIACVVTAEVQRSPLAPVRVPESEVKPPRTSSLKRPRAVGSAVRCASRRRALYLTSTHAATCPMPDAHGRTLPYLRLLVVVAHAQLQYAYHPETSCAVSPQRQPEALARLLESARTRKGVTKPLGVDAQFCPLDAENSNCRSKVDSTSSSLPCKPKVMCYRGVLSW